MDSLAPADPAVFSHIRIVLSMVVSLGVARLLSGTAEFVQHPGRKPPYLVHLLWVVSLLLSMLDFWWWEFSLSHLHTWRFGTYLFIIAYASLFYFLCALLFPSDLREYDGYRDYFMSRRNWFFGLLASTYVVDILDTVIKGRAYLDAQGHEYPLRAIAYVLLCAAAVRTASSRFHLAFAVLALSYQVSWIMRRHAVMGL